jgi:hypothetical protein
MMRRVARVSHAIKCREVRHQAQSIQSAGFLSSRPNWVPLPPWIQGGRHTRLRGRGWRDPIPTKRQAL